MAAYIYHTILFVCGCCGVRLGAVIGVLCIGLEFSSSVVGLVVCDSSSRCGGVCRDLCEGQFGLGAVDTGRVGLPQTFLFV